MRLMRKLTKRQKTKITLTSLLILLLAAIVVIVGITLLPCSGSQMRRSVATVERSERLLLYADDSTGLAGDSTLPAGDSTPPAKDSIVLAERTHLITGCWTGRWPLLPFCGGRIAMPAPTDTIAMTSVAQALRQQIALCQATLATIERSASELQYYLRTHSVYDEGYNTIAEYAAKSKAQRLVTDSLLAIYRRAYAADSAARGKGAASPYRLRRTVEYTLVDFSSGKKPARIACSRVESKDKNILLLQTADGYQPEASHTLYANSMLSRLLSAGDTILAATVINDAAYLNASTKKVAVKLCLGTMGDTVSRHDMPCQLVRPGAPVFTRRGFFVGMAGHGGNIILNADIR